MAWKEHCGVNRSTTSRTRRLDRDRFRCQRLGGHGCTSSCKETQQRSWRGARAGSAALDLLPNFQRPHPAAYQGTTTGMSKRTSSVVLLVCNQRVPSLDRVRPRRASGRIRTVWQLRRSRAGSRLQRLGPRLDGRRRRGTSPGAAERSRPAREIRAAAASARHRLTRLRARRRNDCVAASTAPCRARSVVS